ncbi:TniQ family protein [Streptomyces sp. NPDC002386]
MRLVLVGDVPRPLPPFPNETLNSYCQRLAHANRIPAERLHTPSRWLAHDDDSVTALLRRLTILTGLPRETFWHALPELRWRHEHGMSPLGRSRPPVASMRLRRRWACRRCTATRTPGQHVMTWIPIYTHACLQHRLWIGEAVTVTREQVDLAQMPETLWAQRRHHRLVRRHGERVTAECFRTGGAL